MGVVYMKSLSDKLIIGGKEIKNRLCVPPMYIGPFSGEMQKATEKNIEHYEALAKGEFGLIIQEASCVTETGYLAPDQLGIWSDEQIPQLKKITEAVHAAGGTILVQIHHAGLVGAHEEVVSPSGYEYNGKTAKALTAEEIEEIIEAFVAAAKRAVKAGYDGIELHGCHSYLISQFLNCECNRREDKWGQPEAFALEIYHRIKKEVPSDFIVGIRLGAFEPTINEGIRLAKVFEEAGLDFLDISYGFRPTMKMEIPENWKYSGAAYGAGEIKKAVKNIPVFAVDGICTPEQAKEILELTDVDMIDIGRSALVDYDWAKKALAGEEPGKCIHCPRCRWRDNKDLCAGRLLMKKNK